MNCSIAGAHTSVHMARERPSKLQLAVVVQVVDEAIAACPVNCIDYVTYDDLVILEQERDDQVICASCASVM